jgi:hypothetical protein
MTGLEIRSRGGAEVERGLKKIGAAAARANSSRRSMLDGLGPLSVGLRVLGPFGIAGGHFRLIPKSGSRPQCPMSAHNLRGG